MEGTRVGQEEEFQGSGVTEVGGVDVRSIPRGDGGHGAKDILPENSEQTPSDGLFQQGPTHGLQTARPAHRVHECSAVSRSCSPMHSRRRFALRDPPDALQQDGQWVRGMCFTKVPL